MATGRCPCGAMRFAPPAASWESLMPTRASRRSFDSLKPSKNAGPSSGVADPFPRPATRHAVGEHLGVDAEVELVAEAAQRGIGNGADAHLQRRPILDKRRHVRPGGGDGISERKIGTKSASPRS